MGANRHVWISRNFRMTSIRRSRSEPFDMGTRGVEQGLFGRRRRHGTCHATQGGRDGAGRSLTEELPRWRRKPDHQFVGRLERRFRRAGAEDLIILLTNGDGAAGAARGTVLEENFSVSLALEYRGHWVRLSRPRVAEILKMCSETFAQCRLRWRRPRLRLENLDGSYPYECIDGPTSARLDCCRPHRIPARRQAALLRRHLLVRSVRIQHLMNMIEKILARASGKKEVAPGEVVVANVDLMVMHDLSANFVTRCSAKNSAEDRFSDPSRIAFVFDHNFSPATREAAEKLFEVRRFAAEYGIQNLFDCGNGSLHHVIIENGLWAPGQIIIGCDSHTPIYGALGVFATGVGNNSMAALGFQHGRAWFSVPETIQVFLHGAARARR